jgi:protein melted
MSKKFLLPTLVLGSSFGLILCFSLLALPVAVKFLNKENRELSRNLASYLSLAAIEYTNLLVPYIDIILNSLLCGNYSLARVVLQLYEISSETAIITRTRSIIDILPKCDTIDKNILLQLIATIIQSNSTTNNGISLLIIDKLPQFFDLILSSSTATQALMVLLRLAEKKPGVFHEYIGLLILTAQKHPNTICLIGQILSAIGQKNRQKAQIALEFIMENLPNTDRTSQTTLLQEAVKLCSQYPILFNDKLTAVIRQRNLSQQSLLKPNNSTTSGNITIVNLNSSTSNVPSQTTKNVPVKNLPPQNSIPTSTNSQHYSRRPKFGDSRSTGRLHNGNGNNNAHRSMTRLNNSGVNNSNLGGLHKSMTRLSSSQQINQTQNPIGNNDSHFLPPTIPPPLSHNVMITGENKWGIPSTKITSCGVTVNHTSPIRVRPYSQGPSTLSSIGKSSSNGLSVLNQSTGSISMQNNNISVHHATPFASQQSTSSLAPPISPPPEQSHQVIVSGPTTVTSRKSAGKSVTLLNVNSVNHRMSVFEPSMRDTIQHFCEKHLDKIKAYMKTVAHRLPPPAKCTIEERRAKKFAKLHFACQARGSHCLYSKTFFSMRTRHARVWIHLMFLDLQSRSDHALSSFDSSVSSLKHCWDTLKIENRTFITLVTSAFPPVREQDALINELRNSGFFDVFEIGPISNSNSCNSLDEDVRWGCFL